MFTIFGCLNAGAISMLGILTLFFPVWPKFVADVAAVGGGLIAVRMQCLQWNVFCLNRARSHTVRYLPREPF